LETHTYEEVLEEPIWPMWRDLRKITSYISKN